MAAMFSSMITAVRTDTRIIRTLLKRCKDAGKKVNLTLTLYPCIKMIDTSFKQYRNCNRPWKGCLGPRLRSWRRWNCLGKWAQARSNRENPSTRRPNCVRRRRNPANRENRGNFRQRATRSRQHRRRHHHPWIDAAKRDIVEMAQIMKMLTVVRITCYADGACMADVSFLTDKGLFKKSVS